MAEQTKKKTMIEDIIENHEGGEAVSRIITSMKQNVQAQYSALEKQYPGFCSRNGLLFGVPSIFLKEEEKPVESAAIAKQETKEFKPATEKRSKSDHIEKPTAQGNVLPFALNIRPDTIAPAGTQTCIQPDFTAFTADPIKQYYQNIVNNLPVESQAMQQQQLIQQQQTLQEQDAQIYGSPIPVQQHPDGCNCGHDHRQEEIESAEQVTQRLKNQYPVLVGVENLIKANNCTCQFGSEGNGMIFVMVGDDKSVMDPSRFFAIDLGGNILNRKDKWFPCALPATGYGYEDYPCYELKFGEGCILEYFIKKEMPDDAQMIVGPDQLELNKYIEVVNMPKCENNARAAIMSRLKKAMKAGMFTQENAGMWGTRYRISEITDGNNFKLINDAPIRFGYPVVIPAKKTEIVFEFSNAKINYLM